MTTTSSRELIRAIEDVPLTWWFLAVGGAWIVSKMVKILQTAYFSPLRKIPGPWYARLTSARLAWASFANNRIYYVQSLHDKYGPVVLIGPEEVDIADPVAAKQIHRMGSGFVKAPFYKLLSPGPVDNIFNFRDAKLHSTRRKLYAKGFTLNSLRQQWEPTIRNIVTLTVEKIRHDAQQGGAEILGWWTLMANETVCRLTFNGGHDTVRNGTKDPFVLMLERRMGDLAHLLQHFAPPLYYLGRLLGHGVPRLHDIFFSQETMFEAGKHVVAIARGARDAEGDRNLFVKALAAGDMASKIGGLNDTEIITDAGALLLAGSDPTALSLTYLIWCVLNRPKLQAELESEVAGLQGDTTDAACADLPILNAVIHESLRLYGPAPGAMPRSPPPDGATLCGYYIPPSAVVVTQNWSLHGNPKVWKDPHVFDHTRWLPGSSLSEEAKMSFNPFGQGARQCLGIHLGWMQLRLATAMFFRHCPGAKLAPSTTPESMVMIDSFIAGMPKARRCAIQL
ncbi:cytochrome P450 [Aspergillus sergii]|uniref:Cytochrome P450 n=1 Tax=Aspergillus sergii TaxID=1034303 RepID=A0A5N6WWY4_9EURO|nr:cytochrome P450 [Aspergillus sergii]